MIFYAYDKIFIGHLNLYSIFIVYYTTCYILLYTILYSLYLHIFYRIITLLYTIRLRKISAFFLKFNRHPVTVSAIIYPLSPTKIHRTNGTFQNRIHRAIISGVFVGYARVCVCVCLCTSPESEYTKCCPRQCSTGPRSELFGTSRLCSTMLRAATGNSTSVPFACRKD